MKISSQQISSTILFFAIGAYTLYQAFLTYREIQQDGLIFSTLIKIIIFVVLGLVLLIIPLLFATSVFVW